MIRGLNPGALQSTPRWIVLSSAAYCAVDLLVLYFWSTSGQPFSIQGSPDSASGLSVIAMAFVAAYLSFSVWRRFEVNGILRPAWMLIGLAAAAQVVSGIVEGAAGSKFAGRVLGGPIRLAMLAIAVWIVLRALRKFGFWSQLSATDWAVTALMCTFALCRVADGAEFDFASVAAQALYCVLVLQAMLLRRSVLRMGNGLVSKCWASFSYGILLSAGGEMALWLVPRLSHTFPPAMVASLTQFPTAAIFALGPAYQLIAQCRPKVPSSPVSDALKSVPVLAR